MHRINRRTAVAVGGAAILTAATARNAQAKVVSTEVISQQPDLYNGWPTVARRQNGELLLVCSGGREAHVCPFGRVELMRSRDEGASWTFPRVLIDGPIDDRDAGVLECPSGKTLLATTFTSLAYEPVLERGRGKWDKSRVQRWEAVHQRLDAAGRKAELGCWMIRSTDGGITWSKRYRCPLNSPHGPFGLSDGSVLYPGKALWADNRIGVAGSTDDGLNWQWLGDIPTRDGDRKEDYHELHGVECDGGKLVVQIRNHSRKNSRETLQTHSTDGGKTWATPYSIGVWGLPSHLLKLSDGRLLMSYGHRRRPFGNQARVSNDNGATWSEPVMISDDGAGGDLGYPSTVQLSDGRLLSVWYEVRPGSPRAVLRQAIWQLES